MTKPHHVRGALFPNWTVGDQLRYYKFEGRDQVVKEHAERHKVRFKNSIWTPKAVRVQFLRPDMALVHIDWESHGLSPIDTMIRSLRTVLKSAGVVKP